MYLRGLGGRLKSVENENHSRKWRSTNGERDDTNTSLSTNFQQLTTKINITDNYSYLYTSIEASSHRYRLLYWLRSVRICWKCRSRHRPSIMTFEAYDEVDRGLFCLRTPHKTCSICTILELLYGAWRPKVISGRGKVGAMSGNMNYYLIVVDWRSTSLATQEARRSRRIIHSILE